MCCEVGVIRRIRKVLSTHLQVVDNGLAVEKVVCDDKEVPVKIISG